jgi:hypothetical protein
MLYNHYYIPDLPKLVKWAIDLGIDRVKGHQLWVFHPELEHDLMTRSVESRREWNAVVQDCRRIASDTPLPPKPKHAHNRRTHIKLEHFDLMEEEEQVAGTRIPESWEYTHSALQTDTDNTRTPLSLCQLGAPSLAKKRGSPPKEPSMFAARRTSNVKRWVPLEM